jgi:hypothetical protein
MSADDWTCDHCGDRIESVVEADRMVYLEWLDLWIHDDCCEAVKADVGAGQAALLVEGYD